jgi:hypothetical protein
MCLSPCQKILQKKFYAMEFITTQCKSSLINCVTDFHAGISIFLLLKADIFESVKTFAK